jgi:flagellar protein FliO/FliZ
MKIRLHLLALSFSTLPWVAWAADAAISPTGGVLKMVMGLAVVLAVMALITWVLKRMMPGAGGQQSVVRIVGGVSVGSRERVVVVEVADRWIVVGVAPGQVNGIANLEIGAV